jgi:hypothetical protein
MTQTSVARGIAFALSAGALSAGAPSVVAASAGALSAGAPSVVAASAGALSAGAPSVVAASAGAARAPGSRSVARARSLLHSRELWATVDACNPPRHSRTIGVRGSMPGDGHEKDTMYMRFQLQYLEAKGDVWVNLAHGGDSGFIAIGGAKIGRQGGWSAQLMQGKGQATYTLRGIVTYQWRRGATVLHEASRATSAGHRGVADAEPAGYSAAECTIG